ncbi:anti-sigma-factor antagonist [Candidatus Magnetoovum chiemensis]|nr:anti-sigma-factor antagonist [Candidatus Magnetoovum chiemensis]
MMTVKTIDYKNLKVIEVEGEIDMYTSPKLRKELMAQIRRKTTPLIVDLSRVTYIDSSGIATFVEGLKDMLSYGGKLKLVSLAERILEIFNFARLDKVFEIYPSLDDAINS